MHHCCRCGADPSNTFEDIMLTRSRDAQTDERTDKQDKNIMLPTTLVGAYAFSCNAGPRFHSCSSSRKPCSTLGKPDVDLFIAQTDRHDLPASHSDSTQLKAGNYVRRTHKKCSICLSASRKATHERKPKYHNSPTENCFSDSEQQQAI